MSWVPFAEESTYISPSSLCPNAIQLGNLMFPGCVFPVWSGRRCLVAVIVEALQYVEEKHAQSV